MFRFTFCSAARRRLSTDRRSGFIALLLTSHAALLTWSAFEASPTYDEPAHLWAGLSKWRLTRFDLYPVNPPLAELTASWPILLCDYQPAAGPYSQHPLARAEFLAGRDFADANGARIFRLVTLARVALIPVVVSGGLVCFLWGRDLYGWQGGALAAALWCFSPSVLGTGSLLTADASAASIGLAACYSFFKWLRMPSLDSAVVAGVLLGLAELTKFTWIILLPLWPALWCYWKAAKGRKSVGRQRGREIRHLAAVCLLCVYVIGAGYAFRGMFRPLGDYKFVSAALGENDPPPKIWGRLGNRFADTPLAPVPVPLPADYVRGIDVQSADFEVPGGTYAHGRYRTGGVSWYYIYAMGLKEPIGLWLLLVLGVCTRPIGGFRTLVVLIAPAIGVIALVSYNHSLCYYRYSLPAFGFLFIAAGGAATFPRTRPVRAMMVAATIAWYLVSGLSVAPNWGAYFQELAGGPANGWRYLSGSAVDWGQGLTDLKRWLDRHPEAGPLHLAYVGSVNPQLIGIEFELPPDECEPGWHVISATCLADAERVVGTDDDPVFLPPERYAYFRHLDPVYRAADVLYVYHVTEHEAERVRRLMRNAPPP
jgi:hypothetical protein